jgi:hypothetical protein
MAANMMMVGGLVSVNSIALLSADSHDGMRYVLDMSDYIGR